MTLGLSMPSYLRAESPAYFVTYSGGAGRLDLGEGCALPPPRCRGNRGAVTSLSRESAGRMAWTACALSDNFRSMLTVTVHSDLRPDSRLFARALRSMLDARAREGRAYFWFLEFTRRGMPHAHIFLGGDDPGPRVVVSGRPLFLDQSRAESGRWAGLLRAGHRRACSSCGGGMVDEPSNPEGCGAESIWRSMSRASCRWEPLTKGGEAAARYASKYAAKMEQKDRPEWFGSGRWWGFGGCNLRPVSVESIPVQTAARAATFETGDGFRYRRANWYSAEDFKRCLTTAQAVEYATACVAI